MKTPNPRTIYEKYIKGDALTNKELEVGVEFYKDLADKLIQCGPIFRLAYKEANTVFINLAGFQKARMNK